MHLHPDVSGSVKLSIVVPFFNEQAFLDTLLQRVWAVPLPGVCKELVLVNDGSTDGSPAIARCWAERHPEAVRFVSFPDNHGKGHAVIAGLHAATGDVLIVQDADLEYDPRAYRPILARFSDPRVKVVYGSRILGSRNRSYNRYYWGGRLLSLVANLLYGAHLTDEPTCYKALRRDVFRRLHLTSTGFEFCPELTAKLLRRGIRIHEVPIHYYPRGFEQGKKIRPRDGLVAVWTLLRYRLFEPLFD